MEIKEIIANARKRLGIGQLTPMQHKMAELPAAVSAVALIAPTGSGKTLAFALAMLRRMGEPNGRVRGVVIAPSRELVMQIAAVIGSLAPSLRVTAVYGGHSVLDETRSMEAVVPDVIVGTPGRILDHIRRGRLDLFATRVLVADEYDKSLELGFHAEMKRIVLTVRHPRLVILTSATPLAEMPEWMPVKDLLTINADRGQAPAPDLCKLLVKSPEADKLDTLKQLLLRVPRERTMVFVNHRESAKRVYDFLRKCGFPVVLYHGELDQRERETAVDVFANGSRPVMVSTDLAARGLDIPQVQSVIHYHLPPTPETETHRNGRAARMGAAGDVYYIVGPAETAPADVDEEWTAEGRPQPWRADKATLFFHEGKKEKLSKGDILGALTGPGALAGNEVGTIALHDHRALAAVPAAKAQAVVAALNAARIKGRRVRVSLA